MAPWAHRSRTAGARLAAIRRPSGTAKAHGGRPVEEPRRRRPGVQARGLERQTRLRARVTLGKSDLWCAARRASFATRRQRPMCLDSAPPRPSKPRTKGHSGERSLLPAAEGRAAHRRLRPARARRRAPAPGVPLLVGATPPRLRGARAAPSGSPTMGPPAARAPAPLRAPAGSGTRKAGRASTNPAKGISISGTAVACLAS